jgi:PadR family transcriptional regulator, regulatory protein PadR
MGESKSDVLQGTLDLMVLKTLESMGPLHGYGIARRIEQVSDNGLSLNQGTIYPALLRLQQRGWVNAEWGTSESGRRAKFYSLSRIGRKQIEEETENWERVAATMARFLAPSE